MSGQERGGVGVGAGWEAEGGLYHPLEQEQGSCVFNKVQKQTQCTCQAETIIGSSLTPRAALLVLSTPCSGLS